MADKCVSHKATVTISCNKLGRKCIWSLCERQPWNTRRRYRLSAASSSLSCASLGSLALQAQLPHSESETQPGHKVWDGSQSIRSVSDVQRARALFWNTPSDLWHIGVDTSRLFNEALLVERSVSAWELLASQLLRYRSSAFIDVPPGSGLWRCGLH